MNYLLQILLVPAVAGAILYLFSRVKWVGRVIAPIASFIVLLMSLRLPVLISKGQLLEFSFPWLDLGKLFGAEGFEIGVWLRLANFSGYIALGIALFGFLIVLYSLPALADKLQESRYYAFVLWTIAGSLGAVLADNLIFFLICWEIVTLMLFLLVNLGRRTSAPAGAKCFVILGLADCAMLLGVILGWKASSPSTLLMREFHLAVGTPATYASFLLLMLGAIAKAGAMPLHSWIPTASEEAPTPVMAFLPASLDKLLGIYLLGRLCLDLFSLDSPMLLLLMIIGSLTIVCAVMMAMVQHNLKRLLSFHAVSQVGYMVLGIGTGTAVGVIGGLFHMLNNAIYKCCLFLGAGCVEKQTGTAELDDLGGLARAMPATFMCFLISALAISGVPPLNGFASKWLVYQGILQAQTKLSGIFLICAVFGSALTLASFVKATHSVFWSKLPEALRGRVKEAPLAMILPMAMLALLCVLFGVFAQLPVGGIFAPVLSEMGMDTASVSFGKTLGGINIGIWAPGTATILITFALALGFVIYLVGTGIRLRVDRGFIGGEVGYEEETRVSGTGFYETVRSLPGLRGLYRDATSGATDIYYIGGKIGTRLVESLRVLHTGVLPIYVGWLVLGLAVIIGLLVRL